MMDNVVLMTATHIILQIWKFIARQKIDKAINQQTLKTCRIEVKDTQSVTEEGTFLFQTLTSDAFN